MRVSLALVAAVFAAAPAIAQNADATPTYGEIRLAAGFVPDPHEIHVQAGGTINAAEDLHPECRGYIASAPDINVQYQSAGRALTVYVDSESDTTLIIQGPDGRWYCEDDTVGLNPVVHIPEPQSGRYTIWVGTYRSGNERAILKLSELGLEGLD